VHQESVRGACKISVDAAAPYWISRQLGSWGGTDVARRFQNTIQHEPFLPPVLIVG